jgi:hypothetical protein
MTFFNTAEVWTVGKDLSDLFSLHTMFLAKFLDDVLKPNETYNFQEVFLSKRVEWLFRSRA